MTRLEWTAWAFLVVVILALTWVCLVNAQDLSASTASPLSEPTAEASPSPLPPFPVAAGSALRLAQACWLEASFSLADCRAIKGVISRRAKRAGVDFDTMLARYTALDASATRSGFARGLPDGDEPTWTRKQNLRWQELREAAASDLPDSCDGKPLHWYGSAIPVDRQRAERMVSSGVWIVSKCSEPTKNTFLELR